MNIFSTAPDRDTNDIANLINEFVTVWNKKDAEAFGNLFTDGAEFTDIVRQVARSKSEIIEQHRFPFSVTNKDAVLSVDELHIRAIAPGMILTSCNWEVQNSTTPKGDVLPPRKGVMQVVSGKEGDHWKIQLVHNSDLTQAYNPHINTTLRLFSEKQK